MNDSIAKELEYLKQTVAKQKVEIELLKQNVAQEVAEKYAVYNKLKVLQEAERNNGT